MHAHEGFSIFLNGLSKGLLFDGSIVHAVKIGAIEMSAIGQQPPLDTNVESADSYQSFS